MGEKWLRGGGTEPRECEEIGGDGGDTREGDGGRVEGATGGCGVRGSDLVVAAVAAAVGSGAVATALTAV